MRIINYIFFILPLAVVVCCTGDDGAPDHTQYFIKYYGGDGDQQGIDVSLNADGSMVLLGNSISLAGVVSPFLVKIDGEGRILWQRACGGDNERGVDVELIQKGPYAGSLVVATNIGSGLSSRIRLIRVRQDGSSIDSLAIPSGVSQVAKSVTALRIGSGYAVAGWASGDFTPDPQLVVPPPDEADILSLHVDETLTRIDTILRQGGEHVGSSIKVFEAQENAALKYLVFGYSDRPLGSGLTYELNFEVIPSINGIQYPRKDAGTVGEAQTAAAVIETPVSYGAGYLMAGTSGNSTAGDIYLAKFTTNLDNSYVQRLALGKSLETVSLALAGPDGYVILANETFADGTRNIYLLHIRLDNSVLWARSFGSSGGDDSGGAVISLPDGRLAVVGTVALETQQKMALIVVNATGDFSN